MLLAIDGVRGCQSIQRDRARIRPTQFANFGYGFRMPDEGEGAFCRPYTLPRQTSGGVVLSGKNSATPPGNLAREPVH